jgi:hypothetical protein
MARSDVSAHIGWCISTGTYTIPGDGEEIPAGDRYVIEVDARALRLIVPSEHIDALHVDHSGAVSKPA